MRKNRDNIRAVYGQATADEIRLGLSWYADAHNQAGEIHPDIAVGCGVIAAVSPGLRWDVNVEYARRLILGLDTSGLGRVWPRNGVKAMRILAGESPEIVLFEGKRSGSKVRAFYRCLLNPHNWYDICIDGHAYSIWTGERIPLAQTPHLDRGGRYDAAAIDYTRIADELGILPMQLQAITWQAWRRITGADKPGRN
jgi:hypothetical protein